MYSNLDKIFIKRLTNECVISNNNFNKVYNFFILNNYIITDNDLDSSIMIYDICGVSSDYINTAIKEITKYSDKKEIILIGCISDTLKSRLSTLKCIYLKSYDELEKYFSHDINYSVINDYTLSNYLKNDFYLDNNYSKIFKNFKNFIFVNISTGCNFNCSYCNIKKIKGVTKSVPTDEILKDIEVGISNGKTDVFLLSDDCGSYGSDLTTNFPNLLNTIINKFSDIKIYISNIHPTYLINDYGKIKQYIYNGTIVFMLSPVQHTNNEILRRMNRYYDFKKYIEIIYDIKKNSNIILHNHIIYDYPGESFERFKNTLEILKYFDKTFYNRYSDVNKIFGKGNINDSLFYNKVSLLLKLKAKFNIDMLTKFK